VIKPDLPKPVPPKPTPVLGLIKLTGLDKFTVLISVCIIAVLFYYSWSPASDARYAAVYVGGEKRYIIDLHEDNVLDIEGEDGISQLEIRNGKVRFISSPCQSQFCLRNGWLSPVIGVIACLPNGVSLELLNQDKPYDGINF